MTTVWSASSMLRAGVLVESGQPPIKATPGNSSGNSTK
eukprot:CAMPEP_0118697896 /NCGR_PEP_ID=MMETSP0800-20121206/14837_1 /TAXON_ID=210618 ORGANISM="Striatella unipunctata, Strain CCMP2910" /NCGR_SAMPLE_ID=MMETSP0800 /ASSEMBLY_ACC=CAM_ASM_000638 /LENGTH=37 /DNA_ID= /DNA_START= /DNA_END= /DNA_ORIENTATION=